MRFALRYLGTVGAVLLAVRLVPGITIQGDWTTTLLVALVWSVIVVVIKPVLKILTLPITLLTFGLFSLVLNVLLFYAVILIVPGFEVAGVVPAIVGALTLSIFTWFIHRLV